MKTILFLTVLLIVTFVHIKGQNLWQQTNFNFGGSVYAITIANNGNIIAGLGNKIYTSSDAGSSWNNVYSASNDVISLAKHPSSSFVYAGLDAGGVYFSSNNGNLWSYLGLSGKIINDIVIALDGTIFTASSNSNPNNGGIFKSTDNGTTWTNSLSPLYDVYCLAIDNNNNIYAGTLDIGSNGWGQVLKSSDNGATWNSIGWYSNWGSIKGIGVDHTGNIFAAPSGGVLYKSSDNGISWNQVLTGLNYFNKIPIVVNSNDTIFVGSYGEGVFYSADHGNNWHQNNSGMSNTHVFCLAGDTLDIIYASCGNYIYKTAYPTILPTVPQLISPSNNSTNISLLSDIQWADINSEFYYHLQLATDSGFSNFVINEDSLTISNYQITDSLLYDTTYYWRVKASNMFGESPWSATWHFRTEQQLMPPAGSPILTLPSNNDTCISLTQTLQWDSVETATGYQVQVSLLQGLGNNTIDTVISSLTFNTPASALLENTIYYWRVKGINAAGNGPWSDIWSYTTLEVPASTSLIYPLSTDTINTLAPAFTWHFAQGINKYNYQLSTHANFTSLLIDSMVTDTVFVIPAGVLSCHTNYYWRVTGMNECTGGSWASGSVNTNNFPTLPVAQGLSPAYNAANVEWVPFLTLDWDDIPNATYGVIFTNDVNFQPQNIIIDTTGLTESTLQISCSILESNKIYFWKVRANNECEETITSLKYFRTKVDTCQNTNLTSLEPATSFNCKIIPNPVISTATIHYYIPRDCFVSIKIYNMVGDEIGTLVNDQKTIGNYKTEFNGELLKSGIYFINFKSSQYSSTNKLILIK